MECDYICEHCLAENALRDEICERGARIETCGVCAQNGGRSLPVSDKRVKRIFRALIRLHYCEWDYNQHLGGDSLQSVIFIGKKIFLLPADASEENFEQIFLVLFDEWYPKNLEDISLGGGYWDGCILEGLRSNLDGQIKQLLNKAFIFNHFSLENEVKNLIESIRPDITLTIKEGTRYFRARIGVKSRLKEKNYANPLKQIYCYLPFSSNDIGCPPLQIASEGRLNRARTSILYLASDKETAIAELRPHPGHLVSTAEFESLKNARIANFSSHDIRNFLSDGRLECYRQILSIGTVINLPVQPEQKDLYLFTQLFADCIRRAGFAGISFRSSLGAGNNFAFFYPGLFKLVEGTEAVSEVRSLQYEIIAREHLVQNYDGAEYDPDGDDPVSTLFEGIARWL